MAKVTHLYITVSVDMDIVDQWITDCTKAKLNGKKPPRFPRKAINIESCTTNEDE